MDWDDWHLKYDISLPLQARLEAVSALVSASLDAAPSGPIKLVSLCAGDGRDVVESLRNHPRRSEVTAWLLDTHIDSLKRGEFAASKAGLEGQIQFVLADAGLAQNYTDIAPVDVVLLSGFLGHIRREDIFRLISSLPMLCREGCSVIWNKHQVTNDGWASVPEIRGLLEQFGFEEVAFKLTGADGYAVGWARYSGKPVPLDSACCFFQFR